MNRGSVGRVPSLKNAPGYLQLQTKVASTTHHLQTPSTDTDLFDGQGKTKKTKVALPSQFEVDLEPYGNLVVKAPSNAREDIKICSQLPIWMCLSKCKRKNKASAAA